MIIGVDEVNYSPSLAGDCVVCALVATSEVKGVRDSKQLTHSQRLALWPALMEYSTYAVALATVQDIEQIGVHIARNNAMVTAVRHLQDKLFAMQMKPKKVHKELRHIYNALGVMEARE